MSLIPEPLLPAYTILHDAISLAAIAAGFVVLFGMIANKGLPVWHSFFLTTTILTSVTGFGFPIKGMTPGIAIGLLSLVILAVVVYARSAKHLAGWWRTVYVIGATVAFFFNFFVLIVQSFMKVPALKALAPTQSESPFVAAQITALVAFLVLGVLAVRKFRA
jgi:hypothetical protein